MRRILQAFEIAPLAVRHVTQRDNDIYRVRAAEGTYTLRLHRQGVTVGEVEAELRWLAHLAPRLPGRVPAPVRASVVEDEGRVASLLTWVSGRVPKKPSPSLGRGLGEALAAVHGASAGFVPGGRPGWDHEGHFGAALGENLETLRGVMLPEEHALFARRALRVQDAFRALGDENRTMLHGDFYPLNVLHQGGKLGVIDFANCGPGPRIYDLAIALRHGWPGGQALILAAYERTSPLTDLERTFLPHMIQARMLHMAAYAAERMRRPGGVYDPSKLVNWAVKSLREAEELA
ncbi:MAG: phosphotransferase enzyme family protein [Fimbriimonas sp.]